MDEGQRETDWGDRREDLEKIEEYQTACEHVWEAWEGRGVRAVLTETHVRWLVMLAPWRILLTLTFREETGEDVAWKRWRRLVRLVNEELVGRHYTKHVGHSYFSYVVGMEEQRRGVVHFHALLDSAVDFARIHAVWNAWSGFAHTDVIENYSEAVRYVAKYVLKGGAVHVYRADRTWVPRPLPHWWREFDMSDGKRAR